jgi:uncharacterized protein (TIGR03437 family)
MRLFISLLISIAPAYCADFTTYIGPTGVNQSAGVSAIATDSAGNTYITGSNVLDTYVTGINAFVTKLDPTGNIVYNTSLGGPSYPGVGGCYANAIAVDPAGNVWVGGQDLCIPLVNPLQAAPVGNGEGFLVKIAPDGTVVYSSFFGGTLGSSGVNGVATDQSGNVYVTGWTEASDFPTTPGLPASPVTGGSAPDYGLFVAKLDPTGQKILYSTLIGPDAIGIGITVDGSGNALVTGDTGTADLPFTTTGGPGPGAIVFKINAAGNALGYFTYLESGASVGNSNSPDTAAAGPIAADASGNAYVAGSANNSGFVTKLSPDGTTVWTTSLGALNPSIPNSISADSSGNAWLTGTQGTHSAPGGSFVAELSADGSAFVYAEDFPSGFAGQAIAVDQSGLVHFAGAAGLVSTVTAGLPFSPRVVSILNAASGTFIGQVAPGEVISIYGLGMTQSSPVTAIPVNGLFPTSLGGTAVLVNGTPIPLLYVSDSQINAEIPSPVPGVANNDTNSGIAVVEVIKEVLEWDPVQQIEVPVPLPDFSVAVVSSDFAVFQKPGPSMAVINQDGTLNKIANPAKAGSTVSIWATGFGATGPPADGAVTTAANNYCGSCQVVLNYVSTNITETVEYAGTSPGLIDGLMQINIMIPAQWNDDGAFVYFAPPGYTQPLLLGWINISQ